jgi:UPF0042 nucleotide-binding protein
LHVVIVTGMSGAGRSTALNVLEDLGFFCVDNLPPPLAPDLLTLLGKGKEIRRAGLGIDLRAGAFWEGMEEALDRLVASGHAVEVMFIDCADDALVRRFSEARRPHPLAPAGGLTDAIARERERLGPLRARAHCIFDTTELSVHELRAAIVDHVARGGIGRPMVTRIVSFGFKYGIPVDADIVLDLRYLPNPHFVPELKPLPGTDTRVSRFVLDAPEAAAFLEHVEPLLRHTLPRYEREGKAYLTIALGCTGGRHRSVALAEEIARRLRDDREVRVVHRDLER